MRWLPTLSADADAAASKLTAPNLRAQFAAERAKVAATLG